MEAESMSRNCSQKLDVGSSSLNMRFKKRVVKRCFGERDLSLRPRMPGDNVSSLSLHMHVKRRSASGPLARAMGLC